MDKKHRKCTKCEDLTGGGSYCALHYREYHQEYKKKKLKNPKTRTYKKRVYHGCTYEPWYESYVAMIRRSTGKHGAACYEHVTVCQVWKDNASKFGEWAKTSGFKPGLTIDRINENLGYFPENCQWVDIATNVRRSQTASPRRHGKDGRFIFGKTRKWNNPEKKK